MIISSFLFALSKQILCLISPSLFPFLLFLGLHRQHMEVAGLGGQIRVATVARRHSYIWQHQIPAASGTYAAAFGNAGSFFFFFSHFLFYFTVLSFLGCTYGIGSFPGQGSNQSCSRWLTLQPQPLRVKAASETYAIAYGNPGSLTH